MLARLPSLAVRLFTLAAFAFVAACDLAVPSVGGNSGQRIDPSAPVQVALLVPGGTGSAEANAIASSLENAARLAIADLNGVEVDLQVYNTARDAGQASQMAAQAVADGAKIILGPLDAASANAVGVAVAPANVNVLAFSNNTAIAGGNVFVLGNTFGNISDRLVRYAATQGMTRFLIAHQEDLAGSVGRDAISTSIRSNGGTVVGVQSYPFSQQGIFARASAIVNAANSGGAQGIFVTDNVAGGLPILATSLNDQGLVPATTPLIGITRWDAAPQAASLPGLQNGLFAMADAGREAAFRSRYEAAYGAAPHPLASIAYDGIAAIGALAATGDSNALTKASLTRSAGFSGAAGAFRLRRDGTNERALAVAQIVDNRVSIVDPAPLSFGRGGS
ncbi:penicillin-binding protein activator [Thalassorhabdomicrobium marinisediminis]|uniref:Penicillin-binding protein activator n=1 Tax=Thalassorhabdomicrobium marinisediminis TaxID=2170577 RepID=A0A2T7FYC7_9RHOB|nr:penicillin-binding protein activator [Thalassorhabdomicrobium marinisediminis]PVA07166.1 penicillin-binding protein activator [Thalassorhabdomicrobium marinisediminis]